MDFFEAQDRAKRNTGKLVFLYLFAIIGIILSIYLVTLGLLQWQFSGFENGWWSPGWLLMVSAAVLLTIAIGTAFRVTQLRKGGSAVAEMLGGRRLEPSTEDLKERRLLNIVEEMAIASGMPVPDVYLLDNEENINAFAAGFHTADAAVGVTKGALDQLNRDELQGVIAHEFSHIFNGDMRFNIRLIGVLNGILLIHVIGMIILRSVIYSGGTRTRSRSSKDGGGNAAIIIILTGVSLIIIGYIGMIFGRMIQSAISRQREYLADAAAVQYTRNPDGLAGALNKIGSKKKGAEIRDGHAMEMSHLFFASSYHSLLDKLYSTHPPIKKRIQAIQPSKDALSEKRYQRVQKKFQRQHISGTDTATGEPGVLSGHPAITPEVILAAIGSLGGEQVSRTGKFLDRMPTKLRQAAREPFSAEALIVALLVISRKNGDREIPQWYLESLEQPMAETVTELFTVLKKSEQSWRIPLAELALPTLRKMSEPQYKNFRETVDRLIREDDQVSLFELALEKMVVRQLDRAFSKSKKPEIRHHHLKTLSRELSVLLSTVAYAAGKEPESAWQAGLKPIEKIKPENLEFLPEDQCGVEQIDKALDELGASANPVKKYILSAVIHAIAADKQITKEEKLLLKAITEALDAPMPLMAMNT